MEIRESEKKREKRGRIWKLFLAFVLLATQIFAGNIRVDAAERPSLDITGLSMSVGQTQRLKVSNAKEVKWSSSKRSVATVSSQGVVRARKAGRTTITARYY